MLGKKYYSDNDFTIEFWFYPKISSTDKISLVGDLDSNVGVFYENGNIIFSLGTELVEHTLTSLSNSFHVACVYSVSSASIYINGNIVTSKFFNNFEFINENLNLMSGPTDNANDSFLINSVAIYRYALTSSRINAHFIAGQGLQPIQIADPVNGELFEMFDDERSSMYKFEYPNSKTWNSIVTTGITHNISLNCLELIKTESASPSTVTVEDYISIPMSATIDSSKIEWDGDNGISISTSIDGLTYIPCVNGQQIPQYTLNNFSSSGHLYLRITFTSTDTSRFIPRLYELSILFYNNQNRVSYSGNSYVKTLEEYSGISDYRITIGKFKSNILSRNNKNGLRTVTDSGFEIITDKSIRTVEFFYTPESLTDSGLISTTATNGYSASNISWHNSGAISKTNIAAIYVNGINKTSETNVSNVFKEKELHHIIIVFGSAVSEEIRFNYSLYGSVSALYQYITLYESAFSAGQIANNYDLYIRKETYTITDSTTPRLTEDGPSGYDYDWLVIQSS